MKLQINIDTDNKKDIELLLRQVLTIYSKDKKAKPSEDAAMANKIIDILEGK